MNQGKTMATLATVLKQEGLEVVDHCESESDTAHSSVVFRGDDATGRRAVELAWEYDYEPQGLIRDWTIIGQDFCEPHWMMLFE